METENLDLERLEQEIQAQLECADSFGESPACTGFQAIYWDWIAPIIWLTGLCLMFWIGLRKLRAWKREISRQK